MRPLAIAAAASALLMAAASVGEVVRFGWSGRDSAARLEQEIRSLVAERTSEVDGLAERVAREGPLVAAAAADRGRLPDLFDRLSTLSQPVDQHGVAATVYVPSGPPNSYRVLAWSNGPGDRSLPAERLSGPSALFVAPGHAGLRLVAVVPVEAGGRRIAVSVAETVLAPATADQSLASGGPPALVANRTLDTSFGQVTIVQQYASARDDNPAATDAFTIVSPAGVPLVEVHFSPAQLARARGEFRRRAFGVALLPVPLTLALLVPAIANRRRSGAPHSQAVWRPVAAAGLVVLAFAGTTASLRLWHAPESAIASAALLATLGIIALAGSALWWRVRRPVAADHQPVRFVVAQLAAGIALAVGAEMFVRAVADQIRSRALDPWHFVLFPFDAGGLLQLGQLLLTEIAVAWAAALIVAIVIDRWRLRSWRMRGLAVGAWLLPWIALASVRAARTHEWSVASALLPLACVLFALNARSLRRVYRHGTETRRLLLLLLALLAPLAVAYPAMAVAAERTARDMIELDYAPAVARHPQQLREELARTLRDIDALTTLPTTLPALVPGGGSVDTQAAFLVWSQTGLLHSRVISDIELYDADGALVSRFALNLPEYLYRATTQTWRGSTCEWDDNVFGEVRPFGAESRLMLHAERAICDGSGEIVGGIVVHVASNDYQALPFVSSANPYYDVLATGDRTAREPRPPDLQVAVYGWSLRPLFTSGRIAWPVSQAIFDRLYRDGQPFWTTLPAGGRTYQVHLSQNRAGIYALGYPRPTVFEHAMRLAEIAAIGGLFFVLIELGAVIAAPLARRGLAPLRILYQEIRSSFYRKLFLLFVAAAVVPVVVFALVFAAYMAGIFRADIESEAKSVIVVAQRVFEELAAAQAAPGEPPAAANDDVMVWIRQVIGQDVNLFEGSELVATSQRDLFDSGLLPTRTPAPVYRGVALDRAPSVVAEDAVGDFAYLVAAASVLSRGRDAILTVPLAPRQRELERKVDEFKRGVLVGSVLVMIFAAALGASMAGRVADPVARLTRATRRIAAGDLDVRIAADTADELRRLVDAFNRMAETLVEQRAELSRANQLQAWHEMARQVAHEIKNPLTPIQLAAEHLQHVNADRGRPLGPVAEQCVNTVLSQVRLLRQIASEFSNFAAQPVPRPQEVAVGDLVSAVVEPYRVGTERIELAVTVPPDVPAVRADPLLLSRAFTNLIENAIQAMPGGGRLRIDVRAEADAVVVTFADTGVGMDAETVARAFEPYFSTKTGGSGLGLANARRNVETSGGRVAIASDVGRGTTVTVSLPRSDGFRDATGAGPAPSR